MILLFSFIYISELKVNLYASIYMLNSTVQTPFESHTILYIYKEVWKYPFTKYCLRLYDLLNNHTTQKLLKILIIKNSFCFLLLIVRRERCSFLFYVTQNVIYCTLEGSIQRCFYLQWCRPLSRHALFIQVIKTVLIGLPISTIMSMKIAILPSCSKIQASKLAVWSVIAFQLTFFFGLFQFVSFISLKSDFETITKTQSTWYPFSVSI